MSGTEPEKQEPENKPISREESNAKDDEKKTTDESSDKKPKEDLKPNEEPKKTDSQEKTQDSKEKEPEKADSKPEQEEPKNQGAPTPINLDSGVETKPLTPAPKIPEKIDSNPADQNAPKSLVPVIDEKPAKQVEEVKEEILKPSAPLIPIKDERDSEPVKVISEEKENLEKALNKAPQEEKPRENQAPEQEKPRENQAPKLSPQPEPKAPSQPGPKPILQPTSEEKDRSREREQSMHTQKQKELQTLLLDALQKKTCPDHNQPILSLCQNFSCPKRFWCGICCVKSKDIYCRYSTDMILVDDFLEENLGQLYEAKTFSEADKREGQQRLEQVLGQNEKDYQEVWKNIEGDLQEFKAEIDRRVELLKKGLKERFDSSQRATEEFYTGIKNKIVASKTRDVGQELEELKEKVKNGKMDVLEVIESIGTKIVIDIKDIEDLNRDFDKTFEFVSYISNNYKTVRDQTVPTYSSMLQSVEALGDKIESVSSSRVKTLLEEPIKDLNSLLMYYETMIGNEVEPEARQSLMNEYLKNQERTLHQSRGHMRNQVEEPYRNHDSYNRYDRQGYPSDERRDRRSHQYFHEVEDRKPLNHHQDRRFEIASSSREPKDSHQFSRNLSAIAGASQSSQPPVSKMFSVYNSYANPSMQMQNMPLADLVDLSDRSQTVRGFQLTYFDGGLSPQYQPADIDGIDRAGTFSLGVDVMKDYVPVMCLHNNTHLVISFCKKEASGPVYGFKVIVLSEETLCDPMTAGAAFSSDSIFMSKGRINHLAVLERESDNQTLICINTEDGYIFLFSYIVNERGDFMVELEHTINPEAYEKEGGRLTSMKKLGLSDYLICTSSRGQILTFDTIKCQLVKAEKCRLRLL